MLGTNKFSWYNLVDTNATKWKGEGEENLMKNNCNNDVVRSCSSILIWLKKGMVG